MGKTIKSCQHRPNMLLVTHPRVAVKKFGFNIHIKLNEIIKCSPIIIAGVVVIDEVGVLTTVGSGRRSPWGKQFTLVSLIPTCY